MEQIEIIFSYNGVNTIIQSEKNTKFKDIYKSFKNKVKAEEKLLFYMYNGSNIPNDKLTFDEIANSDDKIRNKMNIVVNDFDTEEPNPLQSECIINSKEIICPECKENIKFKFEDYNISLYECKNKHDLDLFINEFNITQNINISKIICQNCKIYNKGNVNKNIFYKCNTCKLNLCPICYFNHDKNHNIINYDDKNYICEEHNDKYIAYCKDCKQNICIFCEQNHKNDNIINFGQLIPNIANINNYLKQLKLQKNILTNEIKEIINKLNKVIENFDIYYNINENMINNFNKNKINYEILYNINNISNNNIIIKDIDNIINDNNIQTKFDKIINIYNKMNNNVINEGEVYYIQSRISGKMVDLQNGETDNGTNIHLWTSNKTNAQKFRAVKNDCYYSFLSLCNESKALEVGGNNFNIQIWDYSKENDNQKWKLKKVEDEWYALVCKGNNCVMDVSGSLLDDGTNIFCCKEKFFRPNQQFRFININNSFFDSSILSKVNFSCTIRQGGCSLYNTIHQNLVIDAASQNNGFIQFWDKYNDFKNQKWDFIGVGPDTYYIRNCSPNLYYPFICNINKDEIKYKLFDGEMGDEYKWKLIYQGKKLNKDSFLFQNIKTNNYLDSGPHQNHRCGGPIYTNVRCGVEQIFLLAGEEDI